MKLFRFKGPETDWIAADDEAAARDCLKRHYGIDDRDIAGSYDTISEVDPASVEVYPDDYDDADEETEPPTAAEVMTGKTKPFLVASTAQ